jgi:hypothetical protein
MTTITTESEARSWWGRHDAYAREERRRLMDCRDSIGVAAEALGGSATINRLAEENQQLRDELAVKNRRERIATAALQAILSRGPINSGETMMAAGLAVQYADALIAELDEDDEAR